MARAPELSGLGPGSVGDLAGVVVEGVGTSMEIEIYPLSKRIGGATVVQTSITFFPQQESATVKETVVCQETGLLDGSPALSSFVWCQKLDRLDT